MAAATRASVGLRFGITSPWTSERTFDENVGVAYNNPPVPWREIERRLSDRLAPPPDRQPDGRPTNVPDFANGGDSPAWSHNRRPTSRRSAAEAQRRGAVPYAELHCHSTFSFLDGASHPRRWPRRRPGWGSRRWPSPITTGSTAWSASPRPPGSVGLPTVFGAELTLGSPRPRRPRPGGSPPGGPGPHPRLRPAGPMSSARPRWRARRGDRHCSFAGGLARRSGGTACRPSARPSCGRNRPPSPTGRARGHWVVLTGCRKGTVPAAPLETARPPRPVSCRSDRGFGPDHVVVELWDHGDPLDSARNDALAALAARARGGRRWPPTTCTTPRRRPPAGHRARRGPGPAQPRRDRRLAAGGGRCPPALGGRAGSAASPATPAWSSGRPTWAGLRVRPLPRRPDLPPYPCPRAGREAYLRQLTELRRGPSATGATAGVVSGAWAQIDHELALIEALGFPGYFLVVWDIVEFCGGRTSSARVGDRLPTRRSATRSASPTPTR